jgi:excisionase family DNA binding protein
MRVAAIRVVIQSAGRDRSSNMNLALYCSVREAAQIAGCSEQYVRMLLASSDPVKRLRGDKVGHAWLVLREDVERFVRIGRGPASKPSPKRRRAKKAKRPRKK